MADALTIKIGSRYNWRHQPERLVYMGRKLYPGDRRFWFQFALVDKPGECWSEVLESDLPMIEETADGVKVLDGNGQEVPDLQLPRGVTPCRRCGADEPRTGTCSGDGPLCTPGVAMPWKPPPYPATPTEREALAKRRAALGVAIPLKGQTE